MAPDRTMSMPPDGGSRREVAAPRSPAVAGAPPPPIPHQLGAIRDATTRVTAGAAEFRPEALAGLVAVDRRYQLLGQFAEGGQGVISTARDLVLGRYVAVKSLKPKLAVDAAVAAAFVAEAKITAQLDHPAVIPLYELNAGPGHDLHMAMKLVFGRTLREEIDDQALACRHRPADRTAAAELHALKARLEHFVKVCDAVAFAHDKGVVHRDLKPENVMVGQFHEVYVMDWGIARVLADAPAGGISGTPGYIAPEVVAGQPAGPASDQYALGMMLFALAALRNGFRGGETEEVLRRTARGEIEPLRHLLPRLRIPADLRAVIHKALSTKPEDRYPKVAALAEEVRRCLRDEETAARPDNWPRRVLRWLAMHRAAAAVAVLAVVALCAGAVAVSTIRHQRAVIRHRQEQVFRITLQNEVARRAHRIDRHLLRTADILERFAADVVLALSGRGRPPGPDTPAMLDHQAFGDGRNLPAGTIFSAHYRQPVNFATAIYKWPGGGGGRDGGGEVRALEPLVEGMLAAMADTDPDFKPRPPEVLARQAMAAGLPVAWMYLGLADGLMVSYPAAGGLGQDFDPRQRPWYRNAENAAGVVWSAPYVDASGLGAVMSASRALRDGQGRLLGVAAVDMTFQAIVNLLAAADQGRHVLGRYLLDRQGNVMLRADLTKAESELRKEAGTLVFEGFPHPAITHHLQRADGGQFETGAGDRRTLVAYSLIPAMGWYLVEEFDLAAFLARALAAERE